VADVFIDRRESDQNQQWIIEPTHQLAENHSIAMAATLVDISTDTSVKVRLMNPFKQDITIHQGQYWGTPAKSNK
jgi:hypothetical protein